METDPAPTASPSRPARHAPAAALRPGGAGRRARSRLREPSLLLNPASVIAASLAAFLALLVALTVRVATGHDPALTPVAAVRQPAGSGAGTQVTTRASGAPAAAGGAQGGSAAQPAGAPLVTAASGATTSGLYEAGDDGA